MEGAPVFEPVATIEGHVEVAAKHDLVHSTAVRVHKCHVQQRHDVVHCQGETLFARQKGGAAGEGGAVSHVLSLFELGIVEVIGGCVLYQYVEPIWR